MWGFLKGLIQPIVAVVLIPWLRTKVIRTEADQNRFYLIQSIADEAAAEVVQRRPDDTVAEMIQDVIKSVGSAWPTSNEGAQYRAAARAVRDMIRRYRDEKPAE